MVVWLLLCLVSGARACELRFHPACPSKLEERSGELVEGCLDLRTIYGNTTITEPVLIELIKSPAFERLKHIKQYGVTSYAHQEGAYTRYEHSLGVLFILRQFGVDLEEQIDGLLHDVSHTVFSHVADRLFDHYLQLNSYQDEIHDWYLEHSGLLAILRKYGYEDACCDAAKKRHRGLEQDRPDLCADRIEYNLNGGLIDGLLTPQQVVELLAHLHFENQQWFFDDVENAKLFAHVALQLSLTRWGAPWNLVVDYCASQALKRAQALGAIDSDTIHFSDDNRVWDLLWSINDAVIQSWLKRITACEHCYRTVAVSEPHDLYLLGKCSGVDPLVNIAGKLQRLSYLDASSAEEYQRARGLVAQGCYIKWIDEVA
jgi:HD superfamily phosphohydrolase